MSALGNAAYIARPWSFQMELTHGCNLRCSFCPVADRPDLQSKTTWKYLMLDTAAKVAASLSGLNPKARLDLTGRGEPTLNPDLYRIIKAIRVNAPKMQINMFTNGTKFVRDPDAMAAVIDAGVNILNIDCYNGTYERFEKTAKEQTKKARPKIVMKDFRTFTAYHRHSNGERLRVINLVPDLADADHLVVNRLIHNVGGNVNAERLEREFKVKPLTEPLKKKCVKPFREFVTTFDGRVLMCCHDWADETVMGKIPEQSAAEIWYSKPHLDILRALYKGDRSGPLCRTCNYHGGYRVGFLQNPFETTIKKTV